MWRWWWRGVVLRREVHNGPDALEELVERHVGQGKPQHASAGLTTHRQVVLRRGVHNGPDTLEELVERHVARGKPQHASTGLTTHRREALSLYREILRASQLFIWTNEQGVPW
jgi:DNA-binding HxlR family transcriptional regulator